MHSDMKISPEHKDFAKSILDFTSLLNASLSLLCPSILRVQVGLSSWYFSNHSSNKFGSSVTVYDVLVFVHERRIKQIVLIKHENNIFFIGIKKAEPFDAYQISGTAK